MVRTRQMSLSRDPKIINNYNFNKRFEGQL